MIILGISKPKLYKDDYGDWRISFVHMKTDTTEPDIYHPVEGSHIDIPVHSHEAGLMAAHHFTESYRVFPVPTQYALHGWRGVNAQ